MNNKYFYLEPYVYSAFENDNVLLFNTISNDYIFENFDGSKQLSSVMEKLSKERLIKVENIDNKNMEFFFSKCRELFIGDFMNGERPFLSPFESAVNKDINVLGSAEYINKHIPLIKEINIVIGGKTNCKNETLIQKGLNQFLFTLKTEDLLDYDLIDSCMHKMKFDLDYVSIIGNVFNYKNVNEFVGIFKDEQLLIYIYYLDFVFNSCLFNEIEKKCHFVIQMDNEFDVDILSKIIIILEKYEISFSLQFIVSSNYDIEYITKNIEKYEHINYELIPFFENNLDFFEENVFLKKDDILESVHTRAMIHSKMHINRNFFGKLYITPDNNVFGNINGDSLGKISDDWDKIISRISKDESFWFYKRDNEPCSKCIFKYLCPSPSNYEIVINKNNLCFVK